MSYKTVLFIRHNGKRVKRGYVADYPIDEHKDVIYTEPFIVVRVADEVIKQIALQPYISLKLDKLMKKYPSKTIEVEDMEGETIEQTTYGYFHEQGSSSKPYPIITLKDVSVEVKDE